MQPMIWQISEKYHGQSIRDFLKKDQSFSRRILKSVINDGAMFLNNEPVRMNKVLSLGDVLTVELPEEEKGPWMKPENINLEIVFEDDFILVVDKPAHMATIPSIHHPSGTLANAILFYYKKNNIPYTVHIVTRLDRGTSGLILIAKNRYSHSLLGALQQKEGIERHYQAVVTGLISVKKGIINKNIGRKDGSIIERTVREDGRPAITLYETVKHSLSNTLVNIELKTGRTHQIRVHFSALGHPLVGDELYGGKKGAIRRQALHCCHLKFSHPITNKTMEFYSSLPDEMKKLLE